MEEVEYIYELCESLPRCGPGDSISTRKALSFMSKQPKSPYILDIGCGSGAQTIELARIPDSEIVALDNYQGFLDILMKRAKDEGFKNRIIPKNMSMLEMDFKEKTFDIIWSEGALYFMGFENGLKRCHELLKSEGYLAVTELVYLLPDPPNDVSGYLQNEYPDIKDIQGNIETIKKTDFDLLSHFTLSESAWLDSYYIPMEKELPRLIEKYQGNEIAAGVFEASQNEIDFYKKYSKYFGYEFFVMQKNIIQHR